MNYSRPYLLYGVIFMMVFGGCAEGSTDRQLSSNLRARQAVERQRPTLEQMLSVKGFDWGRPVFIRIFKAEMKLEVWLQQKKKFQLFKTYPVCTFGGKGLGPKTMEGDGRAPEGFYYVSPGQLNPNSLYHLSFNLGYPNVYDRFHGYTGSALMVHGSCVSVGCFAMTDHYMEEIYTLVNAAFKNGQPFFRVHIFPFRMDEKKMKAYGNSDWVEFWQNLQAGYEWFDDHDNIPPNVIVEGGKYVFKNNTAGH